MIVQTGNNYYVNLKDAYGNLLAIIPDFFSLDYSRAVNNVGRLEISLPMDYFSLIQPYFLLEVWRNAGGGASSMYLDMEALWFIVSYQIMLAGNGELYVQVTAQDANMVLSDRYVAYYASSAQTSKTGITGDLMKEVVTENIASTASDYNSSTTRGLAASLYTVQANLADGASISMSFAWRNVLSVLQDMANASATAGTYIAFDTVSDGFGKLEFRTYANQRGIDHRTNNPLIIDPYAGNLAETSLTFDYTNEKTFIYAAGQGENATRTVRVSSDSTRLAVSPFARREKFEDSRQSTDATQVQDAADAALRANRGITTFDSKIIETPSNQYGIGYRFGDIIPCQIQAQLIDCRLDKVHVSVANGTETIDVRLQSVV